MPILINCANSLSVIPGNESRMLTLSTPPKIFTSKSGRSASVAGEPVQAAGPKSAASASATTDARDPLGRMIDADIKFRALTDTNNLPRLNISLVLFASRVIAEIRAICGLLVGSLILVLI